MMNTTKMTFKLLQLIIGIFILSATASCQISDNDGHPRILLLEGEEKAIQAQVESSETWRKMHEAILQESENILNLEPLERKKVGRRLLGVSREYLRRIFFLSYPISLS